MVTDYEGAKGPRALGPLFLEDVGPPTSLSRPRCFLISLLLPPPPPLFLLLLLILLLTPDSCRLLARERRTVPATVPSY